MSRKVFLILGSWRSRSVALSLLVALALVVAPVTAAEIAWVSFHPADDDPSAAAVGAGFTAGPGGIGAPDIGYTALLEADGHNVTRVVSSAAPDTALLSTFDLVIVSRSTPSGHYESLASRTAWNNSITAPTIFMSGYSIRSNRLGFMAGNTIPDTYAAPDGADPVTVEVTLNTAFPSHPIFAGIALDGSNNVHYANTVSAPDGVTATNPQLGISVVTDAVAGGGVALATVADADNAAAVGGALIGLWTPGSEVGGVTLANYRMTFLSGSRERGMTSEGAGIYDLSGGQGAQLFLNAVNYMVEIPEPSSALLGLISLVGVGFIRPRRR